jgi:hypothetical protein
MQVLQGFSGVVVTGQPCHQVPSSRILLSAALTSGAKSRLPGAALGGVGTGVAQARSGRTCLRCVSNFFEIAQTIEISNESRASWAPS